MKRPVTDTYWILLRQLNPLEKVAFRKRVCLQYLRWGVTGERDDMDEFIRLIKQWRKEDEKIGSKRTLLERKARKLFQKVRRRNALAPARKALTEWSKESRRKQIGVHSPEYRATISARMKEQRRKELERGFYNKAKHWIVTTPEGEEIEVYDLAAFCREHGLNDSHMCKTAKIPGRTHKGWRARKYCPEWENL